MPQPDDKLREALTRWGHDDHTPGIGTHVQRYSDQVIAENTNPAATQAYADAAEIALSRPLDTDLIDPEPAYPEPLSAQEEADRADRMVPGDGPW